MKQYINIILIALLLVPKKFISIYKKWPIHLPLVIDERLIFINKFLDRKGEVALHVATE